MLQFSPFPIEPAGTRPSTPGCGFDPGAQLDGGGVGAYDGSGGFWSGARAGESPDPWPRAKRSLSGFDCPSATLATVASARAVASSVSARVSRLRPLQNLIPRPDATAAWSASRHPALVEQLPMGSLTDGLGDRPVRQPRFAQLPVALVAREQHEHGERGPLSHPAAQHARLLQAARQPAHLAAAVATLAADQVACRLVDRRHAVELLEDRILRRPERDGVGQRLIECCVRVIERDGLADGQQRRVGVEGVAHLVDELDTRPEVLVERRARDAGALRHLLHARLVEAALVEQLPDGLHDPPPGVLRPLLAAASSICTDSWHTNSLDTVSTEM